MSQARQQVIEQLGVDIDLFLQQTKIGSQSLSELDREILYQSLLGNSRKQIAVGLGLSPEQVRDRLSDYIYPAIEQVIPPEPGEKSGNWVKTLNFLLNPQHGYRLNPAPPLNSDNFQASFGRQMFLYPANPSIGQSQIEATQFYQQGLYYAAIQCFEDAWQQEQTLYQNGNPEVLIYLNNSWVDYRQAQLQDKGIPIYTVAVVVPFHHNQGRIAAEILRGVAQIQTQVNVASLHRLGWRDLKLTALPIDRIAAHSLIGCPIALRILVVNDPNHLFDPFNQTAEKLAALAAPLNIMAVLGHYSSEMTQKALQFYSRQGIPVVNASSTADPLSHLSTGEQIGWFRLSTPDQINSAKLVEFLLSLANDRPQRIAIIYNQNSLYSQSYRSAVRQQLDRHAEHLQLLAEYGDLGERFEHIQQYLQKVQAIDIDMIILIPDGGIDPNSINNIGLISRLNLARCLIAGPATFYQDNILHWLHEHQPSDRDSELDPSILACVPWHWHSVLNGVHANPVAQVFGQIGSLLWGAEQLTWRSATAFDAILIMLRVLAQYPCSNHQALLTHLHQYWKVEQKTMPGVTGKIQFYPNGDRVDPPAEMLRVRRTSPENAQGVSDSDRAIRLQWRWVPVDANQSV